MVNKKVVVGISGGVDSAVACYLLKENKEKFSGLEGVFMKNWDDFLFGNKNKISQKCSQTEDWEDAKRVSRELGVEIRKIVFAEDYWNKVFLSFIESMKNGLTPNPDVLCNKFIKFSLFFDYAKDVLKADYVATGHYAKIIHDSYRDKYYLAKCNDPKKDQTYFLCLIDKSILSKLIFPLSELKKTDVRAIAESIKLTNSKKKDSTGICFIGENNFPSFISNYLEQKDGEIFSLDSNSKIGSHKGHFFFTIGQRKGLFISAKNPHYVISKDVKKNIVYVSSNQENLYSSWCFVNDVNWLVSNEDLIKFSQKKIFVKFRHGKEENSAKISFDHYKNNKFIKITLDSPARAITPGQFAVLYYNEICLGGGAVFYSEKLDSNSKFREEKR